MNEIEDSTGKMVPVSEVKRVHIGVHGKLHDSKVFGVDPVGAYHFGFETIDGDERSSKDYPDEKTTEAERRSLAVRVEQLSTVRPSAPRQT